MSDAAATEKRTRNQLPAPLAADPAAELAAMRAELEVLRSLHQAQLDREREDERNRRLLTEFQEWCGRSTEQKTQEAADKRFAGQAGDLWEVQLQECPKVRLPAHSEYEAIGRYNELCGILGTEHKHTAVCVGRA